MQTVWTISTLVICKDGAGNITRVPRDFYVNDQKSLGTLLDGGIQAEYKYNVTKVTPNLYEPYNVVLTIIRDMQSKWLAK